MRTRNIIILGCFTFSLFAFADVAESISTEEWIISIFSQVGSFKGMTALGIAAFATQAVMRFFKTPLASFSGKWRLLAVSGLSLASVIVGGLAQGMDFGAIMAGSGMLASVQVFVNQLWKQFFSNDIKVLGK